MSRATLRKNIKEIGELEYKIASSREELEGALSLVYKEYLMRGFILPKYYKSGLRITIQHALPGTTTFIALKNKEVVATTTIIPDSPLGLPTDEVYKKEVDRLREKNRKVCEAGYLAIKSELLGHGLFSMFNFKKIDFMFTLFKLALQYAIHFTEFDDICIVTNPKYMIFKFLPFEIIGEVKYYGYDRISVKKKAAVAKRMDLRTVEDKLKQKIGLTKMLLGGKVPQEIFKQKFQLRPKDLRYFFVKKSDIFKNAKKQEIEYIRNCHGLSEEQFNKLLIAK